MKSRWLREENDKDWEARQGRYSAYPESGGFSCEKEDSGVILGREKKSGIAVAW